MTETMAMLRVPNDSPLPFHHWIFALDRRWAYATDTHDGDLHVVPNATTIQQSGRHNPMLRKASDAAVLLWNYRLIPEH